MIIRVSMASNAVGEPLINDILVEDSNIKEFLKELSTQEYPSISVKEEESRTELSISLNSKKAEESLQTIILSKDTPRPLVRVLFHSFVEHLSALVKNNQRMACGYREICFSGISTQRLQDFFHVHGFPSKWGKEMVPVVREYFSVDKKKSES